MAKRGRKKNYTGRCFEAVFDLACENEQTTIVHGWVFSPNLQQWITHAWGELGDQIFDLTVGPEPTQKNIYYELGQIREDGLVRYSRLDFFKMGIEHNHHGPWDKDLFPGLNDESGPPWLRYVKTMAEDLDQKFRELIS